LPVEDRNKILPRVYFLRRAQRALSDRCANLSGHSLPIISDLVGNSLCLLADLRERGLYSAGKFRLRNPE
jgi:hypothetical protein